MKSGTAPLVALIACVAGGIVPDVALANNCGLYQGTDADDVIAIGQAIDVDFQSLGYPACIGRCTPCAPDSVSCLAQVTTVHDHARVCRITGTSYVSTDLTSCTTSTPSADRAVLLGHAGADVIAPHVGTRFFCERSGSHSEFVGDFDSAFAFGLLLEGEGGADRLYGSSNDDLLYSTWPDNGVYSDADFTDDLMCGFDGADILRGDEDDSASFEECMFGGGAADVCDGDFGWTGSSTWDEHHDCETPSDAASYSVSQRCSVHYSVCTAATAPRVLDGEG